MDRYEGAAQQLACRHRQRRGDWNPAHARLERMTSEGQKGQLVLRSDHVNSQRLTRAQLPTPKMAGGPIANGHWELASAKECWELAVDMIPK